MPTTRSGEQISWGEFGSRWKKGMEAITPYQQTKIQLFGHTQVLVGILAGLYYSFVAHYGWLFLILLGSLFVSGVGMLGTYQRFLALQKIETLLKGGNENEPKGIY